LSEPVEDSRQEFLKNLPYVAPDGVDTEHRQSELDAGHSQQASNTAGSSGLPRLPAPDQLDLTCRSAIN
jgi:hypothetical protein